MNNQISHKRFNPLTNEWVLVSPHRTMRPWLGDKSPTDIEKRNKYDKDCYLCPGNKRITGSINPSYIKPFVFTNDFPALLSDIPLEESADPLFQYRSESGICRVICYTPRHDLTLSLMDINSITGLIDVWKDEFTFLEKDSSIGYIQLFENKGSIMGCSNPHPHCQIWASETIPQLPFLEHENQKKFLNHFGKCLLCDYLQKEEEKKERIVLSSEYFTVLVPFWAVWPFEVMILPRKHHSDIREMDSIETSDLARMINVLTIIYDNLFKTSFPYSMGLHQTPCKDKDNLFWHFHFHFYPPLLRSSSIKKFMVGYELLAHPQRDITPEQAAEYLRNQVQIHYTLSRTE